MTFFDKCLNNIEPITRPSRWVMAVLLWLIVEMVFWAMNCTREGGDIAMIEGAVLLPIVGLFKFVMEWSDKKPSP